MISSERTSTGEPSPPYGLILGMRVDAMDYEMAVSRIIGWAKEGRSRYVCVGTVHTVMEAHDDDRFQRLINDSDLVTSDGMPLVWGLRLLGLRHARRVYGPDLTALLCSMAADGGLQVGFLGSTPQVLDRLLSNARRRWPTLQVAYAHSPPFRSLTPEEDAAIVADIKEASPSLLFVGLGCPKQERWMAGHIDQVPTVMVGVGAAFDFLAGTSPQAPRWMMRAGLEWLFRLANDPRRLWYRYLYHNPRFLVLFIKQLLHR